MLHETAISRILIASANKFTLVDFHFMLLRHTTTALSKAIITNINCNMGKSPLNDKKERSHTLPHARVTKRFHQIAIHELAHCLIKDVRAFRVIFVQRLTRSSTNYRVSPNKRGSSLITRFSIGESNSPCRLCKVSIRMRERRR
jgi:hypothetical protein